jgi:alkylation response protein AidB-like acyl-CoA dehydrogenase
MRITLNPSPHSYSRRYEGSFARNSSRDQNGPTRTTPARVTGRRPLTRGGTPAGCGYGYMNEYPIARLYADNRVHRIFGGTSEVMKVIIAKDMGL